MTLSSETVWTGLLLAQPAHVRDQGVELLGRDRAAEAGHALGGGTLSDLLEDLLVGDPILELAGGEIANPEARLHLWWRYAIGAVATGAQQVVELAAVGLAFDLAAAPEGERDDDQSENAHAAFVPQMGTPEPVRVATMVVYSCAMNCSTSCPPRSAVLGRTAALGVALVFGVGSLVACGGLDVPIHDGYRNRAKGWKKPKALEFDEDFEAEHDGELSYPDRKRARWFAVELPGDGELEVTLDVSPLGYAAETEEFEDEDDPFDVAFEIYNENYKVLAHADNEDDDVGERKRSRKAPTVPKGRYLVHVYLQRRLDESEYTLRVKYRRGSLEPETNFPDEVAFVEPLPVVPAFDDAPEVAGRKPCRGRRCKKPKNGGGGSKRPPPQAAAGSMIVSIVGIRQAKGGGTHITIQAGESRGVVKGWKGVVITRKNKEVPGSNFTISRVNARTSTATVRGASPDQVTSARRVRIAPGK